MKAINIVAIIDWEIRKTGSELRVAVDGSPPK